MLSLIDKESWLQPQLTLEPRRLKASHHSYCRAFGHSSRWRIPNIVLMSPTVTTKNSKHKEVKWQQYCLCLAVAVFLILGPVSRKIWWFEGTIPSEKSTTTKWTLLCGITTTWVCTRLTQTCPIECQVRTDLGDCISKARIIPIQSPQYRQCMLISDFLDLANLSTREGAALATNWTQGYWHDCIGRWQARLCAVNRKNDCWCSVTPLTNASHCTQGHDWSFAGIHRHLQRIFLRIWQFFDVSFCRMCISSAVCCFKAPSVEILTSSLPAVNLLLVYSSGKPVQDQLAWLFVLYPHSFVQCCIWSACVDDGCVREGRFRTSAPADYTWKRRRKWYQLSISAKLHFFLMFLLDLVDLRHLLDRQVRLAYHQDGHHPSLNLFQFQWMMATMISHHKKRGNGNGPDRVSEFTLVHKCYRYHEFNLWLLQNLMMFQTRILQLWILHHHQMDHQKLKREVAPEEKNDLDRVSEYLHIHPRMPASSHILLYLLPEFSRPRLWQLKPKMKIQQLWIHKIAWATGQGHHKNKNARVNYRRPKSTSPLIQMKTMKKLETSLESLQPLNLLYQYFLFIKDQQQVLKDQLFLTTLRMKTMSIAMNIVHKVRIPKGPCSTHISTFWPMMSIGHWRRRQTSMRQQPDHFALWPPKMEDNRTYASWSLCRVYNDHCTSMKWSTTFGNMKVEVPKKVDSQTRDMLERCMATCGKAAGTRAKMRSRARKEASAQEVRDTSNSLLKRNM